MAEAVADGDNDTVPRRPGGDTTNNNNTDDDDSPPDPFQDERNQHNNNNQQQQKHQPRRRPIISRTESNASRPREATELGEFVDASPSPHSSSSSAASTASTASISSGEYRRATPRQSNIQRETSNDTGSTTTKRRRFQALRRFWMRHVVLNVPQQGNRDYFALERTFLAYMRTAATFSMQGVLVAQIFRLRRKTQNNNNTTPHLDFHAVGIPLSIAYQACAIIIALIGAYRFWRQQNAIARGKIISGGWELQWIGMLTLLAGLTLFSLSVVIIVEVG